MRSYRAGDENYNIKYSAWSSAITLAKADQATVYISSVPSSLTYLLTDDLDASGGSGTGSYLYEVEDPAKGEIINGDDIRALSGTGSVRVRVYREADENYTVKYSSWSSSISLEKANQSTLYISSVPTSLTYLTTDDLNASGGSGTGNYAYEVENPTKGEIVNGDDIKALSGTGTIRVRSHKSGDSNYSEAYSQWSSSITLSKQTQLPPSIINPQAGYHESQITFSVDGGGAHGLSEWQFNANDAGWIDFSGTIIIEPQWHQLRIRSRWSGDDNYLSSSYSEQAISLLVHAQAAPTGLSETTAKRGEHVTFYGIGGGERGANSNEYSIDGTTWTGFENPLYIDLTWDRLYIKSRWNGDFAYSESSFSSPLEINLLKGEQDPPDSITPGSAISGENIFFIASGGGNIGNAEYQYSLDGSIWNTFSNPLIISTDWAEIQVRSRWSGDVLVNQSEYTPGFDIHISNEEIPLIVPSQPGTIPDSQYAHSSNLFSSDLMLKLHSQGISIDNLGSGNSLELVMSSLSSSEDYQLYQSDINLNGQPGMPSVMEMAIQRNDSETRNDFTVIPVAKRSDGTFVYLGSADISAHHQTINGVGVPEIFRIFYRALKQSFKLYVQVFPGHLQSIPQGSGDPDDPEPLETSVLGTTNPSPKADVGLVVNKPYFSPNTSLKINATPHYYYNFNGNLRSRGLVLLQDSINEISIPVYNSGAKKAKNVKIKTYLDDGSGGSTLLHTESLGDVAEYWDFQLIGSGTMKWPTSVNVSFTLPSSLFTVPLEAVLRFEVTTSTTEAQDFNNTLSVPIVVRGTDLRHTYAKFDRSSNDTPLGSEFRIKNYGAPADGDAWYAIGVWGGVDDWASIEQLYSYEYFNAGNLDYNQDSNVSVQFNDLLQWHEGWVYAWLYSYQTEDWEHTGWHWVGPSEVSMGLDINGDGVPDETDGIFISDDPTSDWKYITFDYNFLIPSQGTVRIERSENKRVEVWRQQGSNSLLVGDQLYTEWDLSVPQQRSDFTDILGNGLWITPDTFSVDLFDGFVRVSFVRGADTQSVDLQVTSSSISGKGNMAEIANIVLGLPQWVKDALCNELLGLSHVVVFEEYSRTRRKISDHSKQRTDGPGGFYNHGLQTIGLVATVPNGGNPFDRSLAANGWHMELTIVEEVQHMIDKNAGITNKVTLETNGWEKNMST